MALEFCQISFDIYDFFFFPPLSVFKVSKWEKCHGLIFTEQKIDKVKNLHSQISVHWRLQSSFSLKGGKLTLSQTCNSGRSHWIEFTLIYLFPISSIANDPHLISVGKFLRLHIAIQKSPQMRTFAALHRYGANLITHSSGLLLSMSVSAFYNPARIYWDLDTKGVFFEWRRVGWGGWRRAPAADGDLRKKTVEGKSLS